ncbi:Sacsin like [Actinidia chinensis var. chinensis]|uniref:Sacsin like n=1 Tax=Actinidia chinensis var. chinensis TaxID=1590841 RepID=A0A2R6PS95_ACTCC|nr:Sacsin like [Actinidia chinensis var. chinensis]
MATPREHIEEIRTKKFKIGEEPDPKNEDLHHAVNYLSAELYAKDVHFLMELIQNAEDNEYAEGVQPSLEFVITSRDITNTGAPATLLVFNNEKGFSPRNVESICSIGRSTKKGQRKRGYIGEKGIGFKSVFLITSQPYIFSNGYQIRFNEEPCPQCKVGYIVPEWVDDNPTLSTINQIYGSGSSLPTTTIVLPLKPDKVRPVKQQLSCIHPELLLFLSKIRRLSVKEDNENLRLNSVTAISISSETNFETRKNVDADSYLLHLSADENNSEKECSYHMWRQRFPVRQENKVERRMEVEELVITLAFPNGQRLNRGMHSPGIYAFLPTEMVTNFPFIIQADFLLASSRETILLGNKWNQGILDYVPPAFISAFIALVKNVEDAPISSLPRMFGFLPVNTSPYPELNAVRETIKAKLVDESIVPCQSYMEQKFFQKPSEVGRLMPAFWSILKKARKDGVSLHNILSHGRHVLSSSFDAECYDHILNFLGVKPVEDEWYAKCIRGSNLVLGVSEEVYLELLVFLAEKWRSNFQNTNIKNIPLLKYVSLNGDVSVCSINDVSQINVLVSREPHHISWLIDWNREFRCSGKHVFLAKSTQEAMHQCSKRQKLLEWLSELKLGAVNVKTYATLLTDSLVSDRKLAVAYVHFLYHSLENDYLSEGEVNDLCDGMPLADNYGQLTTGRNGVLVPANGSKWVGLIGSNPWRRQGFVELGEDYLRSGTFAGVFTPEKQLISFLKSHLRASDVPDISPPDVAIPTMSAPLTKQNTFLLLDWIRNLKWKRVQMPRNFLACIKVGSWMKISLSGSPGYRPPSQSFLPTSSWGELLQNESVLVDIPIIDRSFYGNQIDEYKEELGAIGVMFEFGEACKFIGKHLMSLADSSTLTRANVLSILKFIKFLREKFLSPEDFIRSIREGKWLRTSHGCRSPVGSILFDNEWRAASQISDIPFIDLNYYGEEIRCFKTELQVLGVIISFSQNYQFVADSLKSPAYIDARTAESGLFVLECLHHLSSSNKFVQAFKDKKFLKTNMGYMSPVESYLFNPEWGCLLQVFNSFPLIDQNFYGNIIILYKNELKTLGVVVDFEEATKAFARIFRQQAEQSSIRKENVFSFLACCRKLKGTAFKFPKDLKSCIRGVQWLRTRLGDYKVPRECILFGPEWESIAPISLLPFIDDSDNYYGKGIYEYEKELKSIGVVLALNDGSRFVAAGLYLPSDPSSITPANVCSLLECVRNLQQPNHEPLPDVFLKKVAKKWLKTHAGYRSPDKCLLFDSKFKPFLRREDGPFIDEEFYGSKITSYAKELNAIGVTVEVRNGCPLLAGHLDSHSILTTIVRIYSYLREFNWELGSDDARKIWIPNGSDDGEWVTPGECVLWDKDGLFGMQLKVLEKHYDNNLLNFFSNALGVKPHPSLDDYFELWKAWECSGQKLSHGECCAFWQFIVKHWSSRTEKTLAENLLKLPVYSGSGEILLFEKGDVFIADDLQLKDLFQKSSSRQLFVWYPQPSLPYLPRFKLLEVYRKIGVRNISESVKKEEISVTECVGLNQVSPMEVFIGKGLIKLILGFLAGPSFQMEPEKRHDAVKCLLNLTVLETDKPLVICYSLSLSSGETLKAEARPMIRWERESKKFFTQKMDRSDGPRSIIEYATYFSEAISKGLLWEHEDPIYQLTGLIKLGFLLEFDEEAIGFLMKFKNLQLFLEDDLFLSSAFPSE